MPCQSDYPTISVSEETYTRLKNEADKVTRLLCAACKKLVDSGNILSAELAQWYQIHLEVDRQREEKEQKAKAAELARLEAQKREIDTRIRRLRKENKA